MGLSLHNSGDKVVITMQGKKNCSLNIHISYFPKKYKDGVFRSRLLTTKDVKNAYKYKDFKTDSPDIIYRG